MSVVKRFCEPRRQRRPWLIWFYDTSKQGMGALVIHFANVFLAEFFQGDPCTWYIVSFLLDSSIGLLIIFIGIRLTQHISRRKGWDHLVFGEYGTAVQSHWDSEAWKTKAEMGILSGIKLWDYKQENMENKCKQVVITKNLQRKKVIESVEEGERKVDIAKAFEIPLSSLSTILKNKEKIFSAFLSRVRKRVSKGNFPRLEQCLVSWMRQCQGQNIPMSGSLLKEKTKAFARELGIEFSASEGWLTNFKKRNGKVFKKCAGKDRVSTLTFVLCGRIRFRI
ncbi:major centromere autoantigen B [Trichonephila clavipes]|nr:major centromere autoantigen B [Trichonephila clavipes]